MFTTATTQTAFFTSFFQGPAGLGAYLDATPPVDLQQLEAARGVLGVLQRANDGKSPRLEEALSRLWSPLSANNPALGNEALKNLGEVLRSFSEEQYVDIIRGAKRLILLSTLFFANGAPLPHALGKLSSPNELRPSQKTIFLLGASFLLSGDVDLHWFVEAAQEEGEKAETAAKVLWLFFDIWPVAPRSTDIEPLIEAGMMQKMAASALGIVARENPFVFEVVHLVNLIRNAPQQSIFVEIVNTLVYSCENLFSSALITMMLEAGKKGAKFSDTLKTLAYNKPELFLPEHILLMALLGSSDREMHWVLEPLAEKRKDLFAEGQISKILEVILKDEHWTLMGRYIYQFSEYLEPTDLSLLISRWERQRNVEYISGLLEFLADKIPAQFTAEQVTRIRSLDGSRKILRVLKEKRPDLFSPFWHRWKSAA